MRRRALAATLLLLSSAVLACSDRPTTGPETQTLKSQSAILDGSSGGNPHFFFLPPLVGTTQTNGTFNGTLAPTVEVCNNTVLTADGKCASLMARFSTINGVNQQGSKLDVSLSGQHYSVGFNVKLYALPVDLPFRIIVLVGDIQLGYMDVIASKTGRVADATTGTAINLLNGRTLPIKFRIEKGALCGSTTECLEQRVGPEGGTFTIVNPDGTQPAGTSFPQGALTDTVNLIIERITVTGECLPTDLQQFEGCYRFRTEPHVENFNLPATVGVCLLDPAGVPFFEDSQLRLWKWSEESGDPLMELERVIIDYLVCPPLSSLGSRPSLPFLRGAARVGSMLMKPLVYVLGPRPAYAMIGYEGGKLSNFSRIGWVRPIDVTKTQGDNQTGIVGTALPINPTVRVTNRYGANKQPIVGWRVDFTPSGDGTAVSPFTLTDAAGEASTVWTLSNQSGANTLLVHVPTSRVIAPAPYEVQTTFNANAIARPTTTWLPPLVASSNTGGTFMSGVNPVVSIDIIGGGNFATLPATEGSGQYQANWDVPTLDPNVIYRLTVRAFGLVIDGHVDLQAVGNELRNVTTGDKVLNLDNSRNLPMKFKLTTP